VEVMNSRMHTMMPQGRYAALTLVSINPAMGTIEVWNGGNPYPRLVDANGKIVKHWKSRHVPLGVLPPEEFSAELEVYSYDGECQLFLWSDGLTEAENAEGEQFGAERACATLESAEPEHRFETLVQALDEHRAGALADDITVLMVAVPAPGTLEQPVTQADGAEYGSNGFRMSFHFEALDLKNLDVVPALSGVIERIAAMKEHAGQVFLILSELVSNALDHGLLRMDSSLKTTSDGFAAYAALRQQALKELQEGFIDIDIEILRRDNRKMAKITVRDSGPGFNRAPGSRMPDTGLHGRGIELVRRLSNEMLYTGAGNEVVVYYDLSPFNRAVGNNRNSSLMQ